MIELLSYFIIVLLLQIEADHSVLCRLHIARFPAVFIAIVVVFLLKRSD